MNRGIIIGSIAIVAFHFFSCKVLHKTDVQYNQYAIIKDIHNARIDSIVLPYKTKIDAEMNTVIGTCETMLNKAQPEGTLGNFVCDAILKKAEDIYHIPIDVSICNYGGLRIPNLPQGDITRGKIFELLPFDNLLIVVKVRGDSLQKCFDKMAERKGWPISGATYTIKNNRATDIHIQHIPLQANTIYTVALNDYVALGGDNMDMFSNAEILNNKVLQRDAVIEYIIELTKENKKITSKIDKRVQ